MADLTLFLDDLYLSPYTYSVFAALREKGLEFDVHETHFEQGRTTDPAFAGRTFTDLIPALQHGDLVLSESLAILEYLEERFPAPGHPRLLPASLEDRARARLLLSWYRSGFHALRDERSTETVFYDDRRATRPLSDKAQDEVAEWKVALRTYLKPGASFLFGEWCIADTETALMLHRLIRNGDALEQDLVAYAQAQWRRPSAAEFVERARRPFQSYYA